MTNPDAYPDLSADADNGRQEGLGKTGGLPGHHADPRTRLLTPEETQDTVAMGETAAPSPEPPA